MRIRFSHHRRGWFGIILVIIVLIFGVGKLPEVDPFIEPGKDFIFFGRFDGIRAGSEDKPVAMVTLSGLVVKSAYPLALAGALTE